MKPDDGQAELSLQRLIAHAADAEWQQARDILLGDAITKLRTQGHDGGWECRESRAEGTCGGCDLVLRFEELTQPPAPVMDAYRARFGDLGGAQP